uniref:NADPH-dependent FMN reductase n=1 Tax=Thaumasiovibrio occultus TaxID=1891184 RepID=UPI000B34AC68|nr:NAD(P)H-dependent oxidoreductase [Thaumasiovibrio occultus]
MRLTIVAGSQREHSQSVQVAHYLQRQAADQFTHIDVLDLATLNIPLWNEGVWQGAQEWQFWTPIASQLQQSDAVILITPEWHGMATPALKNFLLLTTDDELAHKPALLVSVSASVNGVYPISELRMTGSKNNHMCILPDHLIFRNVQDSWTETGELTDKAMTERVGFTLTLLEAYAKALGPVHRDMVALGKPFRYGM